MSFEDDLRRFATTQEKLAAPRHAAADEEAGTVWLSGGNIAAAALGRIGARRADLLKAPAPVSISTWLPSPTSGLANAGRRGEAFSPNRAAQATDSETATCAFAMEIVERAAGALENPLSVNTVTYEISYYLENIRLKAEKVGV